MIHTVGVAQMKVTRERSDILITHALGSCLGIAVYDPEACVGGLLHVMLPLSTIDQEKAGKNPAMFVDTGVPKLFMECYKLGAQKKRLMVKVAGGACVQARTQNDYFQIGKRNFIILRKLFWKNGVVMKNHDVGGNISRTMSLDMRAGEVLIKAKGEVKKL